jgi:outer membrane protein insertion porin family
MERQHRLLAMNVKQRLVLAVAALCLAAASWAQAPSGVVSEIVVTGNKNITTEAITGVMNTKVGHPVVQADLDHDHDVIGNMGYFASVDVRAEQLASGDWSVAVVVVEYPKVKEIRVTGNTVVPTEAILKVLTITPGKVFNLRSSESSIPAIRKLYTDKGYVAPDFPAFGPSDVSPGTINVSIVEWVVNSVTFTGNVKTKDRVLQRMVKTKPGKPFNQDQWQKDVVRVHDTQWFEDVKVGLNPSETGTNRIDLSLNVKEARTGQFNIGATLSPTVGLGALLQIGEPNFQGTGQNVSVTFTQSVQTSTGANGGPSLTLNYSNPFYDAQDTQMSVELYSTLRYRFTGQTFGSSAALNSFNQYDERHTGAALYFTRPLSRGDLSASIGGRFEGIVTGTPSNITTQNYIQQNGTVGILTMAVGADRRDTAINASRGDWMRLSVEPAMADITTVGGLFPSSSLLGTSYFLRTTAEYRHYWSAGPARTIRNLDAARHVLALRLRGGVEFGKPPFFEQYMVGGADTLRGYDEDRFWGKYEIAGTLEYRVPVQKGFQLIPFIDFGDAWGEYGTINTFTQTASPVMHLGYGVGISFIVPRIGAIRLDFGMGEDNSFLTYFRIAPPF